MAGLECVGELSVVDKRWELLDPTPDIQQLLVEFDSRFFWGVLVAGGVVVEWSTRLRVSIGVTCCDESCDGKRRSCVIRLSRPLLQLRPRRDLVETLLHEMIHAYLFVIESKERAEHGPQFFYHMKRINKISGAKITVYHDFSREVEDVQQRAKRKATDIAEGIPCSKRIARRTAARSVPLPRPDPLVSTSSHLNAKSRVPCSKLRFWYVGDSGELVLEKDLAAVTINDIVTVGFLVKCKEEELKSAGVTYTTDDTRKPSEGYVYAYLSKKDAPNKAHPPHPQPVPPPSSSTLEGTSSSDYSLIISGSDSEEKREVDSRKQKIQQSSLRGAKERKRVVATRRRGQAKSKSSAALSSSTKVRGSF